MFRKNQILESTLASALIVLSANCIEPCLAAEQIDNASADRGEVLENYSIPEKTMLVDYPFYEKPRTLWDDTRCHASIPARYILLNRPNDTRKVAVIWFDQSGPAILYPRGFEYGPIPKLKDLTITEMQRLWGNELKERTTSADQKVFLLQCNGAEYFLEIELVGNKISKYRVKGPGIRGDLWRPI